MMRNKLIAGVVACAMVFGAGAGVVPGVESSIAVRAEEYSCYEKYGDYYAYYCRLSGELSGWGFCGFRATNSGDNLTDEQKATITSFVIPSCVKEKPVTSICYDAFRDCTSLTSVTIPDSVTFIDGTAFSGCTALTSIVIPDSVTSIGISAFQKCTALTSVTIPGSVTNIDDHPFLMCNKLTGIKVNGGSSYTAVGGVLMTADKTTLIQFPAGKPATNYIVPNSVTQIKDYAIYGCNRMKSVTVPATVTEIGSHAIGYTSAGQLIPDFVIYGEPGSAAEDYALANGLAFEEIGSVTPTDPPASTGIVGDVNNDGTVNASDAAFILQYAAAVGAGFKGTLPEFLAR